MAKLNFEYPRYSTLERIADGAMHFLGVTGALTGTILLLIWTWGQISGGATLSLLVYGLALIGTFVASTFYHFTPWEKLRPTLRRIDHAAIYLKIAGTYTPLVVMIGSVSAYLVLATVWGLAVFGMVKKLFFWKQPGRAGTVLYLLMGWLSVALIWSLIPILSVAAIVLIATGGGLYTVGVIFYAWKSLKFSNAIWHAFVVSASTCFFIAISLGAVSAMG